MSDWSADVCSSDLMFFAGFMRVRQREHHVADLEPVRKLAFDIGVCAGPERIGFRHRQRLLRLRLALQPILQMRRRTDGRWRSEESRVGTECVSTCRLRGSTSHSKKKTKKNT